MKKVLVCGVGLNDVDYKVCLKERYIDENGKKRWRNIWTCPFYRSWCDMLRRAYDLKYKKMFPTYNEVTVCNEWLLFSNFKSWMEKQDWKDNCLDKDLLVYGNKVYSPTTCCFIPSRVNAFLTERQNYRGEYPIGVYLDKTKNLYTAVCGDPFTAKKIRLGRFKSPEEAHQAWLNKKLELAIQLSKTIQDERASKALVQRYENYYTN